MDGSRFDTLAKLFATRTSRRSILKGVSKAAFVATAGSIAWSHEGDAASCRATGVTCTKDAQCCSGECGEKDARGRRRCGCGNGEKPCDGACIPQDVCCGACPESDDPCYVAACVEGECGFVPKCVSDDPCQVATCTGGVCDGFVPACSGCEGCFVDGAGNGVCTYSYGFVIACTRPCSTDADCQDRGSTWYCLPGNEFCPDRTVCVSVPICVPD